MTDERDDSQFDLEKSNPIYRPHKCPVCMKSFPIEVELEEHMRAFSHFPVFVATPAPTDKVPAAK